MTVKRRMKSTQSGVTLIEMMIAISVLSIGLIALAQLFVVATLNMAYSVNVSAGVNDAQRLIEAYKIAAKSGGVTNPAITSSTWDSGTGQSAAFAALPGYDSNTSRFKENVWVFNRAGNLVGSASPSYPPGVASGTLVSQSEGTVLVYVRMEPKISDPRINQTVVLTAMIGQ